MKHVASSLAPGIAVQGLPADVRARAFAYPADLEAFSRLVADVNAFDRHDWFPTAEVLGEHWKQTALFDPGRDGVVLEDDQGWAAMVSVDPQVRDGKVTHLIEGWIRPDRRRQGIGRTMLAWSERHAAGLVARRAIEPWALPQFTQFGILRENPAALGFAEATGYAPVRYGFVMRRDLAEPIPDVPPLPDGIEVRPVLPEHHRAIWDADVEAFRDHFEPRERDESDFRSAFDGPNTDTSMWRVAWDGEQVVGSVMNEIDAVENARLGLNVGWLEHVSVRRPWRGRGVARALIVDSLRTLLERGMQVAALGVDAENPTGALGLYERLGFRPHETWVTYRKPLSAADGSPEAAG
jgi:mycothiol synthase